LYSPNPTLHEGFIKRRPGALTNLPHCGKAPIVDTELRRSQRDDHANDQQNSNFRSSVHAEGVDRILPPGEYRVVTDEELIEELSFPVYRRMATMIFVPADSHRASSVEMVTIDPLDLKEAQDRDAEIPEASSATVQSQSGDDPRED